MWPLIALVPAFLSALVVASFSSRARAQCEDSERTVAVDFVGEGFSPAFRRQVLAELAAGVRAQGHHACVADDIVGEPLARIELRTGTLPRVAVVIEVHDAITAKRLTREVDLGPFPEDSRALALAVASDELLRASWMELARVDAAIQRPAPASVRAVVDAEVERANPSSSTLGARVALEAYTEGELHLGGDLTFALWPLPAIGVELAVGARRGLTTDAEHGRVTATALVGALGVYLRPFDLEPIEIALGLGARVGYVVFAGEATAGNTATTQAGVLVVGTIDAQALIPIGPLELRVGGGAGVPLRGVTARDDGRRITGAAGMELHTTLSLGLRL